MQSIKSIFKIGIGPSSSHTMGPAIACNKFLEEYKECNRFEVELYGSLSFTGKGHLTDWIILQTLGEDRTKVKFTSKILEEHENAFKVEGFIDNKKIAEKIYLSIGGGEVLESHQTKGDIVHIYPHSKLLDIIDYCKENNISLYEYVLKYEHVDILEHLNIVLKVMKGAVSRGIKRDGLLPGELKMPRKSKSFYDRYLNNPTDRKLLLYAATLAVSEENASGGEIVTAPTCGACGVIPGCITVLQRKEEKTDEQIIEGLAVAGLIGQLIATNSSISGAEAGCQAEIGAACSMAAALIAYVRGGTIEQVEYAAEMGLEHNLGLTCDPVKGYVQVPCIERNVMNAVSSLDIANYALYTDGSHIFDFDKIVKTMLETGKDMKKEYRETSLGGMAKIIDEK